MTTPAQNILLLGAPGTGKSSVLQRTMALLPRQRFGGFFVRTLDGERPPLGSPASVPGQPSRRERHLVLIQGRDRTLVERPVAWVVPGTKVVAVDPTSLREAGLKNIETAIQSAEVLVLDELLRLGNACPEFTDQVKACFDADARVLAATASLEAPWLAALAKRPDCHTVWVDHSNRAGLEKELADLLTS